MKTVIYTLLALLAFAGNSVLCRLALGESAIDASSFTSIRLISGAAVLSILLAISQKRSSDSSNGGWYGAIALFVYAATFSFAYISLDTGTGALILFTSVQITMILAQIFSGIKLNIGEWSGLGIAFTGFVILMLPGVSAPSLTGLTLMAISGIAWGLYTLKGKSSDNPLADTAWNFIRTLPLVALLSATTISQSTLSLDGILLAVLSGAIASGAGYTIWYMALRGLTGTQAAVLQLLVPVLATVGGVLFMNEAFSLRLLTSSILILGGILVVILAKQLRFFDKRPGGLS